MTTPRLGVLMVDKIVKRSMKMNIRLTCKYVYEFTVQMENYQPINSIYDDKYL